MIIKKYLVGILMLVLLTFISCVDTTESAGENEGEKIINPGLSLSESVTIPGNGILKTVTSATATTAYKYTYKETVSIESREKPRL